MFYQNVFENEFIGALLGTDRQYNIHFVVSPSVNTSKLMMAFNEPPYDLSSLSDIIFNYSLDAGKHYASFTVDVSATATSTSAVTVFEVVDALNTDATFAAWFTAEEQSNRVIVRAVRDRTTPLGWKMYISNSGAERVLRFNKRAGVAELPSYFARHTIENANNFPDSAALLIELDETDGTDQAIITDAGFVPADVLEDWELIRGRIETFKFEKNTYTSGLLIKQIIYPAGAKVGDLAIQIDLTYSGTDLIEKTAIPHVIAMGDLITPP